MMHTMRFRVLIAALALVLVASLIPAVAARHGTTVAALMQSNNLSDPNFIYVGQRIRLS